MNVGGDSPSISSISRPVSSVSTVSPYRQHITCKDKRKKNSETLIKGKEII